MGVLSKNLSPYHHISKALPPTIIFHGKDDTTVPYRTALLFAKKAKKLGIRCELVGYEGQAHGFFNYARGAKGAGRGC
jgi:acetyl esterase